MDVRSIKGNHNLIGLWYLTMLGQGRANKVFYAANHDLAYVLDWASGLDFIHGAFVDGSLIGVGFVENLVTFETSDGPISRAEMGFGFMENCNVFEALKAGRIIVSNAFSELNLDHAFGTTPELNKKALAYIKRLGFKLYGPIPDFCSYLGKYSGVYTSHISRKEWNRLQNKHSLTSS